MTLTAAVILVGISFFSPYWLSNIPAAAASELRYTEPQLKNYLRADDVKQYPDRGLWAQCGAVCQWFWQDDFMLQTRLLTPLSQFLSYDLFLLFVLSPLLLLLLLLLLFYGQNPLHQFPHSKSVTSGQKSVVSCLFPYSIITTCLRLVGRVANKSATSP